MAKFDFNNSRYARFFNDASNQNFMNTYLNTEGVLYTNYGWYKTQCKKADRITPTVTKGLAAFTQKARKIEAQPMLDLRAPLAKGKQMDKDGISWYTASIPDFISSNGYSEDAMEREQKEAQFNIFGNDADIVKSWTSSVQDMIDSADGTFNFMTAQLQTSGMIDYTNIGRGIQAPLHKANIPTENFCKAGTKVWTDSTATILTYMKRIEAFYRDKWGFSGALTWKMPKDMFYNVFLPSPEVKALVTDFRKLNYIASTDTMPVSEEMFRQAFVDYQGVSPIEIVIEKERNITRNNDEMVHGWKQNIAVLAPAGKVCDIQYTEAPDRLLAEKYGSSAIIKTFANVNDGLCTIINTTRNNGEYKEWATDLITSAVPALNEFPNHVIVDTATAGEVGA